MLKTNETMVTKDAYRVIAEMFDGDLHYRRAGRFSLLLNHYIYISKVLLKLANSLSVQYIIRKMSNRGSSPFEQAADLPIVLQVGERRFTTRPSTLASATFFESLVSGRWESARANDGSYFVDADADLFEHILRYLRRDVFPIFYNASQGGFDHALYSALQEEAAFFGIERLRRWIADKEYLKAVKVRYSVVEIDGPGVASSHDSMVDGDSERSYYSSWGTKQVYKCPRGIYVHDGNPSACGRQCENAKREGESCFVEQDILRTLIVEKKVVYNNPNEVSDS